MQDQGTGIPRDPAGPDPGKPLLDKLGVMPGHRVLVFGPAEPTFVDELRARGAEVWTGRRRQEVDLVFLAVESTRNLVWLRRVRPLIQPAGAVWVIYPKGRKDLREIDVIQAGLAAGMVDNKVVRFSETHTALRFVIRLSDR